MNSTGIFQIYPLIPVAACLAGGIVAGDMLRESVSCVAWFLLASISLFVTYILKRHPVCQSIGILVSSCLTGCALAAVEWHDYDVSLPSGRETYEAVIVSECTDRGRTVGFDMTIVSGPLCGRTVRATLAADTIAFTHRQLGVGAGLVVCSRLARPVNFHRSNFDYVRYLQAHAIVASTYIARDAWYSDAVSLGGLSVWQRARLRFMMFRHSLIEHYRTLGLDHREYAVVAAMTLGHRSELSNDMRQTYSAAGVSHVLALSGMHLGIIYMLLSFFPAGRRLAVLRECVILIVVWAYIFMVGMPASALRSAFMITLYSAFALGGNDRTSLNVLAFIAIVMLIVSPYCIYDVGFQLSFLSVGAIQLLYRPVCGIVSWKFQQRHHWLGRLWRLLVMTLSAQLATAPLVLYYFGTFPLYPLLSNIIAIPAVTAILYVSVVTLILSFVPAVQIYAVWLLSFITSCLNMFLLWVASLPYAAFTGVRINALQLILIYASVILFCCFCYRIYRRYFFRMI